MGDQLKTIKATLTAFATEYSRFSPADIGKDSDEHVAQSLSFYSTPLDGWTRVGTAEITITFDDHDTMVGNKIEALRKEKRKVQEDAEAQLTRIEGQIQNLLALPAEIKEST